MTVPRDRDPSQDQPRQRPLGNVWFNAITIASIITVVVTAGLLLTPPSYEATVLINFDPRQIEDQWDLMKDETRVIDFEGQVRSRAVLAPALREVGLTRQSSGLLTRLGRDRNDSSAEPDPDQKMVGIIKDFQPKLTVERMRQSSLLRISVKMTSPEMAAKTANAIARSFFNLKRRQFLDRAHEKLDAIEREMGGIREDLASAMNELNDFRIRNGWNDYDLELKMATDRASILKQDLSKYGIYKNAPAANGLDEHLPVTVSEQSALLDQQGDVNLSQLIEKMNELNTRYLQVRSRFKEDSPPVLQVTREKADLEKTIDEYILNRRHSLSAQLESTQKKLEQLLTAGPKIKVLQNAVDHLEKRHQELMDQRSAIRLQINAGKEDTESFGELRLLDRAVVPETVSAIRQSVKIWISVIASFFVSFCLLLIIFEVWNHALSYRAQQCGRLTEPYEKIL